MRKTILVLISLALLVFSGWYLSSAAAADPYHTLKKGVTLKGGVTLSVPVAWSCGSDLEKAHTAGDVAPVTKTVTYGTVTSSLSGASKCWITQNLGADQQASVVDDSTEASAGWYWQFNLKQGYKHDGSTLTPSWTVTSIDQDSDWTSANDPCTILLGTGWRLPTSAEWATAYSGWGSNMYAAFASVLVIHNAGCLDYSDGDLDSSGQIFVYWSSTQSDVNTAFGQCLFYVEEFQSGVYQINKATGASVRCLKD